MKSVTVCGWFASPLLPHTETDGSKDLENSRATSQGDHFCLRERKVRCSRREAAYVAGVAWRSAPKQQTGKLKVSVSRSKPDAFEDSASGCTSHELSSKVSEF